LARPGATAHRDQRHLLCRGLGDDVGQHILSFQQFPPRQRPGSFSVEQAMEKLRNPPSSN
jgi:hypothetical protein